MGCPPVGLGVRRGGGGGAREPRRSTLPDMQARAGRSLTKKKKKKKCSCTQVSQKCPRAHHVLVVGGWQLAVGNWRLMAFGGG